MAKIGLMNSRGPYIAILVPNSFEMDPLVENKKVIIVMTRLSMVASFFLFSFFFILLRLNVGITTDLLLALFEVKGVVHYGIAGNAIPQLQIGDVNIPQYWAHTGLWNWQLALESNGDYTREIGYLEFANYNNASQSEKEEVGNLLIRDLKLGACVNSLTCLPRAPRVVMVERGVSTNVFVDNKAYREFLRSKFDAVPIDMESAGVALVCSRLGTPFIALRSLPDLAGGGSSRSNEAYTYTSLTAQKVVDAAIKFISLLPS
ncbi:hypothetical protein ACJRO7_014124 [Eucalyptus globulus]|uniref:Nucleoside phosphorylase domain-containing protein n=1 Tax=Eucalyptus globulus TaxID=34317 RepID=A0ABD3L528_EUCGL